MPTRALVTGAEGFVGPYLIDHLLEKGYEVVGTRYAALPKDFPPVKVHKLDILDKDKVLSHFRSAQPDVVFHLAAANTVSLEYAQQTKKVNIQGSRNILEACTRNSCAAVVIGSAQQYGIPKKLPITESHPKDPVNPYGESKNTVEDMAMSLSSKSAVYLLRSFNHIGPGQRDQFVTSAFAKQIASIEKGASAVMRVGDLSTVRDFTDVRDIVQAYALCYEQAQLATPYNICSGVGIQIQEILDLLLSMSKAKIKVVVDPARYRKAEIPKLIGDPTRFKKATGWKPKIPLKKSLKDILDYWRAV